MNIKLIGIEGLLWASKDIENLMQDKTAWAASLEFIRTIESDKSIIGVSPHIMGVGTKPSQ